MSPYGPVTKIDKWRAQVSIAAAAAPLLLVGICYLLLFPWVPRLAAYTASCASRDRTASSGS